MARRWTRYGAAVMVVASSAIGLTAAPAAAGSAGVPGLAVGGYSDFRSAGFEGQELNLTIVLGDRAGPSLRAYNCSWNSAAPNVLGKTVFPLTCVPSTGVIPGGGFGSLPPSFTVANPTVSVHMTFGPELRLPVNPPSVLTSDTALGAGTWSVGGLTDWHGDTLRCGGIGEAQLDFHRLPSGALEYTYEHDQLGGLCSLGA